MSYNDSKSGRYRIKFRVRAASGGPKSHAYGISYLSALDGDGHRVMVTMPDDATVTSVEQELPIGSVVAYGGTGEAIRYKTTNGWKHIYSDGTIEDSCDTTDADVTRPSSAVIAYTPGYTPPHDDESDYEVSYEVDAYEPREEWRGFSGFVRFCSKSASGNLVTIRYPDSAEVEGVSALTNGFYVYTEANGRQVLLRRSTNTSDGAPHWAEWNTPNGFTPAWSVNAENEQRKFGAGKLKQIAEVEGPEAWPN